MRKQILVSVDRGETRVAVREAKGAREAAARQEQGRRGQNAGSRNGGWQVGELYVERRGQRSIVGNIYKGVIDNVLPGMEAAFVDIGLERNGFLHVDEIVTARRQGGAEARPRQGAADRRADQAAARRSSSRSSRTR